MSCFSFDIVEPLRGQWLHMSAKDNRQLASITILVPVSFASFSIVTLGRKLDVEDELVNYRIL